MRNQEWRDWEVRLCCKAVIRINDGASVYSQVKKLWEGRLAVRTWESIRSKINRMRKEWRNKR